MRCKTRVLLLIVLLSVLICHPAAAKSIVDDEALLLSASEKASLSAQVQDLSNLSECDFFLVTTDDAQGKSTRTYAEDYFMGHKNVIDGAVWLIDMDNREIYMALSGKMIYVIDDDRKDEILDRMYDKVADGKYAEAFQKALKLTGQYLKDGARSDVYLKQEAVHRITGLEALIALAIGLGLCIIFWSVTVGKYRLKFGTYHYSARENSSMNLTEKQDIFVNRVVTHRRIKDESSSSSGGGHSSTVHTGSGGNTFGGGGRKF